MQGDRWRNDMGHRSLAIGTILLLVFLSPSAWGQEFYNPVSWSYTGPMVEDGTWDIEVTSSGRLFMPGDGLTLGIEFNINSVGLTYNIDRIEGIYTLVTGSRVFDENGNMIGNSHAMVSTLLTGVGLPVEGESFGLPTDRFGGAFHHPIDSYMVTPTDELTVDLESGTLTGTTVHGILLNPDIPAGWYQIRVDVGLEIVEGSMTTLWGQDPTLATTTRDEHSYIITSPVAVGTELQPRMTWTLFSQMLPNGGVIALEDQGYAASTRGIGFNTRAILPMTDSRGSQARYLIEPEFPLVWNPFMRGAGTQLDLDYHSGWMEVRIENPDETIVNLGGAPFSGRRGMGATTLQNRFEYSFSSYGRHRIEVTGWISDASGQIYTGGGVYEVYVARLLDIEPNILPGTPFRKNEYFDSGFQLFPSLPANVEIAWELDPWSREDPNDGWFTARANRWGYFSPPIVSARNRIDRETRIQFNDPGEYRVTYRATYREPDGTLWLGEKTITGIVYSDDPIELASRPPSTGSFSITSDARYHPVPADSGDTMLIPVPGNPDLPTVYTFPIGFILGEQTGFRTDDSALLEVSSGTAGTFVVPRLAGATGLFPRMYHNDIDRRAYIVSTAARSDSYEQSRVGEGNPAAHLPYPVFPWLPGELSADGPGDLYHFWSGMVYRDITSNTTRYGYYSAGGAVSSSVSSARVHVEGAPLVNDGWGTHSLVMHNTAIRPGSIVSEGAPFTPGAYYLPLPLNSTLEFTVTPPHGDERTITITGDNRGYANNIMDRFDLDRQGVWLCDAKLFQDDEVGGILGVNIAEPWAFYVIDSGNSQPIRFHLPPSITIDEEVIYLTGDLLEGDIVEGTAFISTTFNGAVIEQTSRTIMNGGFIYSVDLVQVSTSYPSFDPQDPADRLVISVFVIGRNVDGGLRHAARLIYYEGGNLYAGEKDYSSIDPLTREERLRELAEMAETLESHEIRDRVPIESETETD